MGVMEELKDIKPTLKALDWGKWRMNALIFSAPMALIYLFATQNNIADGFEWADFVPNMFTLGSIASYLISTAIDFFKKFMVASAS